MYTTFWQNYCISDFQESRVQGILTEGLTQKQLKYHRTQVSWKMVDQDDKMLADDFPIGKKFECSANSKIYTYFS